MMRNILSTIILLTLCLINLPMFGHNSVENVANEIFVSSPRLKTLKGEIEAERATARLEGNLPDPEIEGEFLAAPAGESNRWGAGISWGLDWPGVYSARKDAALAESEASLFKTRIEQRDLAFSINRLILDYILQSRQIEVVRALLLTTDSISILAGKAARGGEMTRVDLNKISLEKGSLESRLLSFENQRNQTISLLSEIAGKDCTPLLEDMELTFPVIPLPKEEEISSYVNESPRMLAARANIEATNAKRKVVKNESMPSLNIGYRHAFEDGNHFNGATVGVSVPLFSNQGKKKALEASIQAAELSAEETKLTTDVRIRTALQAVKELEEEISRIAPALEDTDNLELLMRAYKSGVITLIEYLNERKYFIEATLELLHLRHADASSRLDIFSII